MTESPDGRRNGGRGVLTGTGQFREGSERFAEVNLLQVLRTGPSIPVVFAWADETFERCQRLEHLICR
jgi:hypothetical protein